MSDIPSVLLKIKKKKESEVDELYNSGKVLEYEMRVADAPPPRDFTTAISKPGRNLIAEFKKASPSEGEIRPGAEPEEIAQLNERCGASAISVLTDSYFFDGEIDYLRRVRNTVTLPILRKDFIIHHAQIYEARVYGADAVLLIDALLESSQIKDYIALADSLGMSCLVESHDESELEKAVEVVQKSLALIIEIFID